MSLRLLFLKILCCVGSILLSTTMVAAGDSLGDLFFKTGEDKVQLQLATYVHYKSSDDYEGPPIYGAAEVHKSSGWLYGLGLFNNSYDQFSQYLYVGRQFNLYQFDDKLLHFKVSAGAMHGYHDEHEDTLPWRIGDIGPVIIPAVGIQTGRWSMDLVFLVDEALMFNFGFELND